MISFICVTLYAEGNWVSPTSSRRGRPSAGLTVSRWCPTCMCGTTETCPHWPGTCGWGWDEEPAANPPESRAAETSGSPTRPSNLYKNNESILTQSGQTVELSHALGFKTTPDIRDYNWTYIKPVNTKPVLINITECMIFHVEINYSNNRQYICYSIY